MEERTQNQKNLQRKSSLVGEGCIARSEAKERHAFMRERAWILWCIALQAYGITPGPAVDVATGNIGPSGSTPARGPCRMW